MVIRRSQIDLVLSVNTSRRRYPRLATGPNAPTSLTYPRKHSCGELVFLAAPSAYIHFICALWHRIITASSSGVLTHKYET